ncbi:MAG: glycosyltransferase family 39 protein [Candidatus Sungbacteria bacterium]|uniref:Glycosyltransferase family 39 protein n=1 Tax=Candidatus Sungiibacteriota bacterium TaxID=2750080 RepID=A0A931YDP4_9BACT|nr:glycosyltransferase family 39 protein [Candidatus Sungbacteria bacterium]
MNKSWPLVLLIIFASLFYLINLGRLPLEDYDEATYAAVLKSSLERGDFLSFEYFGQNWFEKPPLYFWLAAASVKVFGFNEFALRFPSAIFGIMSVLAVYLILAESLKDRASAFLGGIILILIPFFTAATRNMRMDTPVTACILAALYFYLVGIKKEKYFLGVGIAIGLGVLFKSIIGLLAAPIILIWSASAQNWRWLKNKFFWLGNLAGFLIAAPWHIYESVKFGGAFWQDYLGYHVFGRFNENILGSKITVGYYFHSLWKLSQPVIPLILTGAILLIVFIKHRRNIGALWTYLAAALASIVFIFILFSLSQTKLITYYTPLYPFAALVGGLVYYGAKNLVRRKWPIHLAALAAIAIFGYYGLSELVYPQIYVTRAAADEKAIGLYLGQHRADEEINIFNWNHHNTIRYYSGRLTDALQFNTGRQPGIPSWLIMPTDIFELNTELAALAAPYRGEYLTLVHLADEK